MTAPFQGRFEGVLSVGPERCFCAKERERESVHRKTMIIPPPFPFQRRHGSILLYYRDGKTKMHVDFQVKTERKKRRKKKKRGGE